MIYPGGAKWIAWECTLTLRTFLMLRRRQSVAHSNGGRRNCPGRASCAYTLKQIMWESGGFGLQTRILCCHHSDRGSQYCSHDYRNILKQHGFIASMSRKGNCYDNAPMESFWGTLKQELVHHRCYRTRQEAIRDITEYLEIFYKRQRLQPGLGFLSPAVFEQRYYESLLAA